MIELSLSGVNWLAVVVTAIVVFMIGGMWYAPLFGKAWVKAQGFTEEQVKEMQAKMSPPIFFGGMLASYFVLALVVAVIFHAGGIQSASAGAMWGFLFWLIHAAFKMTDHIASGKVFAAFTIDASFQLIALLVTGVILGAWR